MKKIRIYIVLSLFLLSCNKIKEKGNNIMEKLNDKMITEHIPKKISIKEVVKEFDGDSSIKEIMGIQLEDLFNKEYFVYTGKKTKVLGGINNIAALTENPYSLNSNCALTTIEDFYSKISLPNEKSKYTAFFWKFEKLKRYEIYTAIKKLNVHYIIFDSNSDTIYHRIEEIKD
jgi:hypothetical protein